MRARKKVAKGLNYASKDAFKRTHRRTDRQTGIVSKKYVIVDRARAQELASDPDQPEMVKLLLQEII